MLAKVNILRLIASQNSVYGNELGQKRYYDYLLFGVLPIIISGFLVYRGAFNQAAVDFVARSIAFLTGFIFSAFVVIINIVAILKTRVSGRNKTAALQTVRDVAQISIFVFLLGVLCLTIVFLGILLKSYSHEGLLNDIVSLLQLSLFISIILHLLMLSKKVHFLISEILE